MMNRSQNKLDTWPLLLLIVIGCGGYVLLGYVVQRTQFIALISVFGLQFGIYTFVLTRHWSLFHQKIWLAAAIIFRCIFLFSWPSLSDDFYRFIWDGRLVNLGINPYLYRPDELINQDIIKNWGIYSQLNSPHYYSVYPPLNQFIFALVTWLGNSIYGSVLWLRGFVLMAEFGTIFLLWKSKITVSKHRDSTSATDGHFRAIMIYALNPLVIVELTGNLHFEAFVVFFLVLFFSINSVVARMKDVLTIDHRLFTIDRRGGFTSVIFALAVSVKLLPLMFLPAIIAHIGWRRGLLFSMIVIGFNALLFLPFIDAAFFLHIASSLDLYYQKFEFNASFYYLLRALGQWLLGYNAIHFLGPILALTSGMGIVWIGFRSKIDFHTKFVFSLALYLFCATTVHPWYVVPLVGLSVFTTIKFPLFWSGLAVLSYGAYSYQPFQENGLLLALEYGVVLILCFKKFRALVIHR